MIFQDEFRIHLWFCLIHLFFIIQQNQTRHVAMFSSKTVFPGHPNRVIPSLIWNRWSAKKQENISQQKLPKKKKTPKNNPNILKKISKIQNEKTLDSPLHRSHPPWAHWRTWSTQPIARPVLGANGDQLVDLIGPCRCKVAKVAWWLEDVILPNMLESICKNRTSCIH